MGGWGPWQGPLGLDLAQNHHLETPAGRRARYNRASACLSTPDSAPCSWGPGSWQELLVTALAQVLCQVLYCILDMVFSLNLCQVLRGGVIIPMSQMRKPRLRMMSYFLGVRQPVSARRSQIQVSLIGESMFPLYPYSVS